MSAKGTQLRNLTNHPASDSLPTWSPDDRRIAFVSNRNGKSHIYVMGVDGSNPQRLTDTGPGNSTPAWSPDGTRIVFSSARDGNSEIYVMNADGTNPQRLTNNQWTDDFPAWSPDGTRIVFRSFRQKNEIHLLDYTANSQKSQPVYVADGWLPRWSPDGRQVVYARNRDIWTTTADGRKQVNLTKNPLIEDRYPAWQPSRTPHRLKTKLLTQWATLKITK